MVYKMFMSVNNFVGHTDKNEKEKYFQNKYVGQIGKENEKEMLLKGGTNKQGQEEPWAMFRSHEFQGRSVTIALVTPLPTWSATAFFKS